MMKKRAIQLVGTLFLLLAFGCSYPEPAKIQQEDTRPSLGVSGAPASAVLFLDGLKIGPASKFDGTEHVLKVESGTHRVEIKSATGETLFSKEIFLSPSTVEILDVRP